MALAEDIPESELTRLVARFPEFADLAEQHRLVSCDCTGIKNTLLGGLEALAADHAASAATGEETLKCLKNTRNSYSGRMARIYPAPQDK